MSVYITREMIQNAADENRRDGARSFFSQLGRSLMRRMRRRQAIAELEAMDDALLRDIGICRNEIRWAVDGFTDRDLGLVPPKPAKGHWTKDTGAKGGAAVSA